MPKLNDTQTLLLSHAAKRDSGALYPLPDSRNGAAARAAKAITALSKLGLAEERETNDAAAVSRSDGDLRYGVFVTAAGLAAIGVELPAGEGAAVVAPVATSNKAPPKSATVLALLQRSGGATLAELIVATGWLPHTTRAALTGLRKKGHTIERSKRAGATCYRIATSA